MDSGKVVPYMEVENVPGGKQFSMRAELGLPAVTDPESIMSKKPIKVNFPYHTLLPVESKFDT